MNPIILVAVGILVDSEGQCLLNTRPMGKSYEGYWEFPGGKIEPQESALNALKRELKEEIGIDVYQAQFWLTRHLNFARSSIHLHFFLVSSWEGEPSPQEGQLLSWQKPSALMVSPVLEANQPILRALNLPPKMLYFDGAHDSNSDPWLLVACRADMTAAKTSKMRVPIIGEGEWAMQYYDELDGILLSEIALHACKTRPPVNWLGVYVTNDASRQQVLDLKCDFAIVKNANSNLHGFIPLYAPLLEKKATKISARGYIAI